MLKKSRIVPFALSLCLIFGSLGTTYGLEEATTNEQSTPAEATNVQAAETSTAVQGQDKETAVSETKAVKQKNFKGTKMKIEDSIIEWNTRKEFTVTLTIPKAVANNTEAQSYAESLEWYLDRDKEDSPYWKDAETKKYFKNIYTGDKLKDWKVWATDANTPGAMFPPSKQEIKGIKKDKNTIEISFKFKNEFFFGSLSSTSVAYRNAQGSIVGNYDFYAKDGDTVVAADTMRFAPYQSYRTYPELRAEIQSLIPAARAKGYELKIEDIGVSEGGFTQYSVIFGKKGMSDKWLQLKEKAESDPTGLQKKVDKMDYAIPMFMNNVHPDECPGSDTIVDTLKMLIENNTIDTSKISGWKVSDPGGYITPPLKELNATTLGRDDAAQGASNVADRYNFTNEKIKTKQLMDNVFFVMVPNENPDGRISNGRRNGNGFDLNRDGTFQTQSETQTLEPYMAKWNPIVMNEYHGYVSNFLIEPCSPPHEQNLEYDITISDFYKMAEVYGTTALGSLKDKYPYATKEDKSHLSKFEIPLRDYFSEADGEWKNSWDDLSTNYGPSYAMINCGSMGYTIEIPYNNQMSTDALTYGNLGMAKYMSDNKARLFKNQLEFFKRGIQNIDVTTEQDNDLEKWYYNLSDKLLEKDAWRVKYDGQGENGKYFPEYYVIPKDQKAQRDIADVNAMEEFLDRNGVEMKTLKKDTKIDGTTYKEGTLIVDMRQAKRNYANAVLWQGIDAGKDFSSLYSECVVNFPELRGFTAIAVAKENAIPKTNLADLKKPGQSQSILSGDTKNYAAVIVKNNGSEAVLAVNYLLDKGTDVGMVQDGANKGQFLIEKAAWKDASVKYILDGAAVKKADGTVKRLKQPTIYIPGLAAEYTGTANSTNANPYWGAWFADGFGSSLFKFVMNSGTYQDYSFDYEAYKEQMGFKVSPSPEGASIIVGSMAVNSGEYGTSAISQVNNGKPYISTGVTAMRPVRDTVLPADFFTYTNNSGETMHKIKYVDDSIITAPQKASGDDIIYNYGTGRITSISPDAEVLYKAETGDYHIAGCFPSANVASMANKIEAFTYQGEGRSSEKVDVTVFANSVTRKAHQQDDYLFVSNSIFSKHVGDEWEKYSSQEKAKDIGKATVSAIEKQVYSGKAITPAATVMLGDKKLTENVDYTVTYENNTDIGEATVMIIGKGNYTGTKIATFKIIPKAPIFKKVSVGKSEITVKWMKVDGSISKYQIRYKKAGGASWKTETVSSENNSFTINNLKKGKKYHVQIRAIKVVNKIKYCSSWNKISAKIK